MSIFIKGLNRLIKGMKMPKLEKTYKVRLYKAVNGSIIVTACGVKDNLFRPVGEAIEIKTPHGKLIDADMIEYENWHLEETGKNYKMVGKDDIDGMPAIIEAEGAENDRV